MLHRIIDKVVMKDELITPPEDYATEILRTFMQVSVNINPAELEIMADLLLDSDHPMMETDNSCEKVVVGNECRS